MVGGEKRVGFFTTWHRPKLRERGKRLLLPYRHRRGGKKEKVFFRVLEKKTQGGERFEYMRHGPRIEKGEGTSSCYSSFSREKGGNRGWEEKDNPGKKKRGGSPALLFWVAGWGKNHCSITSSMEEEIR